LKSIGDRLGHWDLHALAGLERTARVVGGLRFDANHPRPGGHHRGAPSYQSATPDGGEKEIQPARLLEQLERSGALAGHHEGIVERPHEGQAALLRKSVADRLAVLRVTVVR